MSINPNVHLRLRRSTHDKLRAALELSAHRSLSSLADEILDEGLTRRLEKATDDDLARATAAAESLYLYYNGLGRYQRISVVKEGVRLADYEC